MTHLIEQNIHPTTAIIQCLIVIQYKFQQNPHQFLRCKSIK